MKILIMVLSCMKPPYDEMYRVQKQTWDSVECENVKTVYYFGEDYNKMHIPFKEALIEYWNEDWDVIFRTNSSSYIDKNLLYNYFKDMSTTRLWVGAQDGYCSGAGFLVSRDLALILKDNLHNDVFPYEDVLINQILVDAGYSILCGKRTEYNHEDKTYIPCYHIRCKDETSHIRKDVLAFKHIFDDLSKK